VSESDRQDPEGHEPTEEVGPTASEVDPERTGVKPGAIEGQPQESQVTFQDELGEAFVAEPLTMILSPQDGLPIPAEESHILATAPPFSIENVVCVEDERSFVELYGDEVHDLLEHVDAAIAVVNGPRYTRVGAERARMSFTPERVVTKWGHRFVELTAEEWATVQQALLDDMPPGKALNADLEGLPFVAVRPVRERCQFYKRQVFSNDDQPDAGSVGHYIIFRNCTERRSVGGAFMSLRDEAVHACDYRSPPHPESVEKHLDKKDRHRLLNATSVTRVPLFNLPVVPEGYVPPEKGNPMAPKPVLNIMQPSVQMSTALPSEGEVRPDRPRVEAPVAESTERHDRDPERRDWESHPLPAAATIGWALVMLLEAIKATDERRAIRHAEEIAQALDRDGHHKIAAVLRQAAFSPLPLPRPEESVTIEQIRDKVMALTRGDRDVVGLIAILRGFRRQHPDANSAITTLGVAMAKGDGPDSEVAQLAAGMLRTSWAEATGHIIGITEHGAQIDSDTPKTPRNS